MSIMMRESANLRKKLFSLGLIILLAGLIFVAVGSIKNERLGPIKKSTESWEVSENLMKGNTYVLDVMSSTQWRDNYTGAVLYETELPVDMVITSPDGGETKLQAFFLARLPTSPWYKSTFPSLVRVEYGTVDSDSLEVDESYPRVRFTVKQKGDYTARIIEETLNWTQGLPREMILYIVVVENVYPIFFPSGGILCLVGIVVSVVGAKATEKKRLRKGR